MLVASERRVLVTGFVTDASVAPIHCPRVAPCGPYRFRW